MWKAPPVLVIRLVPTRTADAAVKLPQGVVVDRPSTDAAPSKRVPAKRARRSADVVKSWLVDLSAVRSL